MNDLDVEGKRVLIRVDFNVPLDKKTNEITDDKRIRETLPTIKYLIGRNAKVILCSHLGRPDGKTVDSLKMGKVATRLGQLLKKEVKKLNECVGNEVKEEIKKMKDGDVVMLENLRFHPEEELNDEEFSKQLAELAEIYVNDAFGTCHRAHASTYGVTNYIKSAAGFLVEKELRIMGKALEAPDKPLVSLIGGVKVSDKIKAIENLIIKSDKLLLGGAMIFSFYKANGLEVGSSKIDSESVELAGKLLSDPAYKGKIFLPSDVVIADKFEPNPHWKVVDFNLIPNNWIGLDIGPRTIEEYKNHLKSAKTVIWSGPIGVFEFERFANGTKEIAKFLSELKAVTIVGGGDSAAAVEKFGYADKLTHVSTGGGASLEFFEGRKLPGIEALEKSYKRLN